MNKLLIGFLALFIYSCKSPANKYTLDQESRDIYGLALDNSTGSDTFYRYHTKIPPMRQLGKAEKVDSLERIQFLKWRDSLRLILDTAQLFVVINHNIDTISNSDITSIREIITSNQNNLDNKINGDTSFNETLRKLYNNKLLYDTIDVTMLKTQFNFKICSDRYSSNDKVRKIGTVRFSKIAFSHNKNKAAVYTSFICGSLCGSGQILFFEKQNDIWKYIRTWEMWVA